jgi:transposase
MPVYFFRTEPSAAELRRLARQESGRVCQRMLLIANLLEGMEREDAARALGFGVTTTYHWHNRYEEEGIDGLHDKPGRGRHRRLTAEQEAEISEHIGAGAKLDRDGVVAFRGGDVQAVIEARTGHKFSLTTVYRMLHRHRLSWLVPRPRHPEADAEAQAAFPQLLSCNSNESPKNKLEASESKSGSKTKRALARRTP